MSTVLPPLNRPISPSSAPSGTPCASRVEQRRLVDLQGRDPVIEAIRREQHREILEAVERARPAADAVPLRQARVAQHDRLDRLLARRRSAGTLQPAFHEVCEHAGGR